MRSRFYPDVRTHPRASFAAYFPAPFFPRSFCTLALFVRPWTSKARLTRVHCINSSVLRHAGNGFAFHFFLPPSPGFLFFLRALPSGTYRRIMFIMKRLDLYKCLRLLASSFPRVLHKVRRPRLASRQPRNRLLLSRFLPSYLRFCSCPSPFVLLVVLFQAQNHFLVALLRVSTLDVASVFPAMSVSSRLLRCATPL